MMFIIGYRNSIPSFKSARCHMRFDCIIAFIHGGWSKFLLAGKPFFTKKEIFANLSRTPCLIFAGAISSGNRLSLVVLHSNLSISIKHHIGIADDVEVLQGRLARILNHHHWMNLQNWWRMSWKSYQRLLHSYLAGSVAAWLGQGSAKQTFIFAFAFAEFSRIFPQKMSRHWWISRRIA